MMKVRNKEVKVILVRFDELNEVRSYIYLREDAVPKMNNLVVGLKGREVFFGYVVGYYNIELTDLVQKANQFGILKCPIEKPVYATDMTKSCIELMAYTVV